MYVSFSLQWIDQIIICSKPERLIRVQAGVFLLSDVTEGNTTPLYKVPTTMSAEGTKDFFILVKMASSLASIAETWPENVLPQWQQKIADAENNCSSIPKPERLKRLQAGV